MGNECYVFDTSALINTRDLSQLIKNKKATIYLSQYSLEELSSSITKGKLEVVKENYNIVTTLPSKEFIEYTSKKCKKLGILSRLSAVDLSVLSLLIELKKEKRCKRIFLVTDDYWMQNFAMSEGIPFIKAMFRGIKKVKKWGYKCEYCGKKFNDINDETECPICGGPIKKYLIK